MRKAISMILIVVMATFAVGSPRSQEPATTQEVAQEQLTNKDVLEMLRQGLATEIVVAKIKATPSKFDTSPAVLAELKAANVPDAVIVAMVQGQATSSIASTDAGPVVDVKVPDGTEIEIQLSNTLSGQEAKVGDIVDFTVMRAIKVNGVTVFDRDASARARLTMAKKSGRWGKAGKLEWAMQDVQAVDGNRIPARFTKREVGDSKGGTVAVAAVATTLLAGPFALLWGLKKGRPAIIPAGNRYTVFVHGDTTIKAHSTSKDNLTP
jgi:hypothetical protein